MAKTVLIADDSTNTRGILRFMLQNQGFGLVEAEDGEDALAKARSSKPDLIVLDGMMPKKSGFVVCRELKEDPATARIPIILLTAIAQVDASRDWSKESPADKFMEKPFHMKDLISAIEKLVGPATVERKAELDPRPQGTGVMPKPNYNAPR